ARPPTPAPAPESPPEIRWWRSPATSAITRRSRVWSGGCAKSGRRCASVIRGHGWVSPGPGPGGGGLVWWRREVWPALRERHPAARLVLAGSRPAGTVRRAARQPGIELHEE